MDVTNDDALVNNRFGILKTLLLVVDIFALVVVVVFVVVFVVVVGRMVMICSVAFVTI